MNVKLCELAKVIRDPIVRMLQLSVVATQKPFSTPSFEPNPIRNSRENEGETRFFLQQRFNENTWGSRITVIDYQQLKESTSRLKLSISGEVQRVQ